MAPKAKPARRKSIEVKCGSVVVKIYEGTNLQFLTGEHP
jgi:hypothetical protein